MNDTLLSTVAAALERAGLTRADARLLAAVSGGADSVALLWALCELRARYGFTVGAAHVEHGLRGESSRADMAYVQALCQRLNAPCLCYEAALPGGVDAPGAENRAREARYRLLREAADKFRADALLLAHHRDDQAETVLMRLLRGGGARGLGGMRERAEMNGLTLLRPLLTLPKAALAEAAQGLGWREDASNAERCCRRNRIRLDLLPALEREQPRAAEHIARTAERLALDDDCLQSQADALLARAACVRPPFWCAQRAMLTAAHPAIALRALRRFAQEARDTLAVSDERALSYDDSLALLALLNTPGASLNLPGGVRAECTEGFLHMVRMADGSPLRPWDAPGPIPLADTGLPVPFGALTLTISQSAAPPDGRRAVALPAETLARCVLRLPKAGDWIYPFGAPGRKALRRYLTDRKLDRPFRAALPVLCDGDEALWVVGVGASEQTRLAGAPCVTLTAGGELPWLSA